jgi:hypothetical protein
MWYVWAKGFMSLNVNRNLSSMEVQCGLRFVWSEEFEKKKEGQWVQEIQIKAIWPFRNLKLLFDEEGCVLCGYWTELRWSLAHANVKLYECICYLICIWFVLCLFCVLVFCHSECDLFITKLNCEYNWLLNFEMQVWIFQCHFSFDVFFCECFFPSCVMSNVSLFWNFLLYVVQMSSFQ